MSIKKTQVQLSAVKLLLQGMRSSYFFFLPKIYPIKLKDYIILNEKSTSQMDFEANQTCLQGALLFWFKPFTVFFLKAPCTVLVTSDKHCQRKTRADISKPSAIVASSWTVHKALFFYEGEFMTTWRNCTSTVSDTFYKSIHTEKGRKQCFKVITMKLHC